MLAISFKSYTKGSACACVIIAQKERSLKNYGDENQMLDSCMVRKIELAWPIIKTSNNESMFGVAGRMDKVYNPSLRFSDFSYNSILLIHSEKHGRKLRCLSLLRLSKCIKGLSMSCRWTLFGGKKKNSKKRMMI
jgi:hypothetical protein